MKNFNGYQTLEALEDARKNEGNNRFHKSSAARIADYANKKYGISKSRMQKYVMAIEPSEFARLSDFYLSFESLVHHFAKELAAFANNMSKVKYEVIDTTDNAKCTLTAGKNAPMTRLGLLALRLIMRRDGVLTFNKESRKQYLIEEYGATEDSIDWVVGNILRGQSIHIFTGNKSVSRDVYFAVEKNLLAFLERELEF